VRECSECERKASAGAALETKALIQIAILRLRTPPYMSQAASRARYKEKESKQRQQLFSLSFLPPAACRNLEEHKKYLMGLQ